jgi:tetratricopeptide (TPR) repeat protein
MIALVFTAATLSRNAVWRDSVTLWSDCVQKSPDLALAHESLGLALVGRGRVPEGTRELQAALRLEPTLPQRSLDSGIRAARTGLLLQAILSFQTALLYDPRFAEAHYNLAVAFEQMGWSSAAIQEYRATIAQAPDHAEAHNNLGIILAQTYRLDDAIHHFDAAVRARPRDPELHMNLARAYEAKGLAREAQEQRALAALAGVNLPK